MASCDLVGVQSARHTGGKIPLTISLALWLSALCDMPTYIHTSGGLTGSALTTTLAAALCVVTLPTVLQARSPNQPQIFLVSTIFAVWVIVTGLVFGVEREGLQQIAIFVLFPCLGMLTASITSSATVARVYRLLAWVGWAIASLYAIVLLRGGLGATSFVGRRSFALEALVLMAAFAFSPRGASALERWLPAGLYVLICLSLSRTAMAVGAILLVIQVSIRRGTIRVGRVLLFSSAAAVAFLWLILTVPVLQDRFSGGDQALDVGGFTLSTQGRDVLWETVLDEVWTSPVIGHGTGAARRLIEARVAGQTEPHNDFIRVLYDAGVVGLTLLIVGLAVVVVAGVRRSRDEQEPGRLRIYGALAAVVAVILGSLTDNSLVYSFVMIPLALVVGLAFSTHQPLNGTTIGTEFAGRTRLGSTEDNRRSL